jgi:hypothetical protein
MSGQLLPEADEYALILLVLRIGMNFALLMSRCGELVMLVYPPLAIFMGGPPAHFLCALNYSKYFFCRY